ncbi:hypothetical protein BH23BAC3_BH23BAC3_05890 [soil metagenome]
MKFVSLIFVMLLFAVPCVNGQNWNIQEKSTETTLNSVYFVDRFIGWAAGDEGNILHTTDGGQTWIRQNSRTSEHLNSIHFFDEITGWIAGNENIVLHTNSGGENWTEQRPNPVSGQNLTAIQFRDWKRGWSAGGPGGQVYFSDNRGTTWQRQISLSAEGIIASIHFPEHSYGVAGFENHIHLTRDGGESWLGPYLLTGFGSFRLADIHFISDSLGWAIGNLNDEGLILKTEDGGQNWSVNSSLPATELRAIHFADKKIGGIVGVNGLILHTENAGDQWTRREIDTKHTLNDIYFPDAGTGWAVGENGSIYQYFNPAITYSSVIKKKYPHVEIVDDSEAIDLLNRILEYGTSAVERDNPEHRGFYYSRMLGAIREVSKFYKTREMPERISDQINTLIDHYWSEEFNNGAELYNKSMELDESSHLQETAKFHFHNAILIQPDSVHPYLPLARIKIALQNRTGAIDILEQAFVRMDPPVVPAYELLIDLYLYENLDEKARALSESAIEDHPSETQFYEVLVDLHITADQTEQAIPYLDTLIELKPETIQYYQMRGNLRLAFAFNNLREALRLYEEVWRHREELYTNPPYSRQSELRNDIERLLNEVVPLDRRGTRQAQQAVSDLEKITELQPNDHEAYGNLGMIFQERASIQYEMRTLTFDQEDARRYDPRIQQYLEQAKTNYNKALELNPGIREYRESLYYIYRHLGMDDEAEEIREIPG